MELNYLWKRLTFFEITHARIGGGPDLPWKFQIYRIHLVKFLKIAPFPFGNKVIVPTHASIPPPGGNLYSLASIFMDFVTIKISMISKFVANDLINSLCYKKLDFVEH